MLPVAHYYDGLSSRAHPAEVELVHGDSITIILEDQRFAWALEDKALNWERTSEGVRIAFGEYPRAVLLINEAELSNDVVDALKSAGSKDAHDSILQGVRKMPLLVALALMLVLGLCYFFVLPPMAEEVASAMPVSADETLGDMVWNTFEGALEIDHANTPLLDSFAQQLSLSDEYDLQLYLVDDEMVNAFALPGGRIVVFTGILDRMGSSEELVALIAHETVHVQERHSSRQLVRDVAGYAFISLLLGDVNSVLAIAAEHADGLRGMAFSRELESEADAVGMQLMHENQVDPNGMVKLLELLQDEAKDMPEELDFLSTHPLTSERIAKARENLLQQGEGNFDRPVLDSIFDALKNREAFDPMEEGEGFLDQSEFNQPADKSDE